MALMQASSMAGPKKMMAPLGPSPGHHGPGQRDIQDRGPQGPMVLPPGMNCPPLVRKTLGFLGRTKMRWALMVEL